jgi:hypothetical protein
MTYAPDHRTAVHSTLASDVPTVGELRGFEAGAYIETVEIGRSHSKALVEFPRPSAAGMALKTARLASVEAMRLQPRIQWESGYWHGEPMLLVTQDSKSILFDYFEHCLVAIVSSFQAVESYANLTIDYEVKTSYPWVTKKNQGYGVTNHSVEELQRWLSTNEKVAKLLPNLLGVVSPKSVKIGQDFDMLRALRDDTIHMKSKDQNYRADDPEKLKKSSTLFTKTIGRDITEFPRTAVSLIAYFDDASLRWPWLEPELAHWQITRSGQ